MAKEKSLVNIKTTSGTGGQAKPVPPSQLGSPPWVFQGSPET